MEYKVTLYISTDSSEEEAPIQEFLNALEFILTWQWNNVMMTSEIVA